MSDLRYIHAHYFERLPEGRLLNVGSGVTGTGSAGRFSINVDLTVPMESPDGAFVQADARSLPFRAGVFAGALLKDVIEHVHDPAAVLREVHRVTSPGAALLLSTPRAIPRAVWADYTHIRGFTERALLRLLTDTGWTVVGRPRRMGALPGAGRLRLSAPTIETILRLPILGHRFGTNWLTFAKKVEGRDDRFVAARARRPGG